MNIPDASLGAIVAALIAAAISFIGLIISKDQKTSEYRQAWIDSLRVDIAELLAHLATMSYQIRIHDPNFESSVEFQKETFSSLKDVIIKAEKLHNLILLRLNPNEHKHIIAKLEEVRTIFGSNIVLDRDALNAYEMELLGMIQKELKKEWKRVKSGEPIFRITKYLAISLIIISCIAIGAKFVDNTFPTSHSTGLPEARQ